MRSRSVKNLFKSILVLLMIFAPALTGWSAPKQKRQSASPHLVITYDYLSDAWSPQPPPNNFFKIKRGQNVLFKVINLNPFRYKAIIDGKASNYFQEMPAAFSALIPEKTTSTDSLVVSMQEKLIELFTAPEAAKKKKQLPTALVVQLELLRKYEEKYNAVVKIPKVFNALRAKLVENKPYKEIKQNADKVLEDLNDLKNRGYGDLEKLFTDADAAYNAIKFDSIQTELKELKVEELAQNAVKDLIELNRLTGAASAYKDYIAKVKKGGLVENIERMLRKLDELSFEHGVQYNHADSDEIRFSLKIEPLEPEYTVHKKMLTPIRVLVKGGLSINFSTGFIMSVDPRVNTWTLEDSDEDENKVKIVRGSYDWKMDTAVAAFMHFYRRTTKNFVVSPTIGIGTKDTSKLSLFAGCSFIFGRTRRAILNIGLNIYKGNVLKEDYNEGDELVKSDDLKAENLVTEGTRFRAFIGFSWNLSKLK